MDRTFQVPMQYCSLQHWTLLPSSATFTTGCCFCFGSISSFFLELFLHSYPVEYWTPINLGRSSFSVIPFYLFILFMGFSRQEYWSGLPFPFPVDHVLSELSTKGEKERYIHLNEEFQRISRRDQKAFLSDQCKEMDTKVEWERLAISSRKLETSRKHFMQRWAQ